MLPIINLAMQKSMPDVNYQSQPPTSHGNKQAVGGVGPPKVPTLNFNSTFNLVDAPLMRAQEASMRP